MTHLGSPQRPEPSPRVRQLAPSRAAARRVLLLVVVACLVLLVVQLLRCLQAATTGEHALQAARADLQARDVDAAFDQLTEADAKFRTAQGALRWAGPAGWLAEVTPLLRIQFRAVHAMTDAGAVASSAGLTLIPIADRVTTGGRSTAQVVADVRAARPGLDRAVRDLAAVQRRMQALAGYRLLWPLNSKTPAARSEVDKALVKARHARQAVSVLLDVTGGDGPRRYLVLSQNPDEPRPTGGYMGTYGVLTGTDGTLRLASYGASGTWNVAHPQAAIPPGRAPVPFGYVGQPQTLGNSNTLPDWPSAARTAVSIWDRAGEPPVDGVLTFTPGLLTRLIAVLGPTRVPGYPDVVTAKNLDERLEFHTHSEAAFRRPTEQRKQFIADLARVVLDRLVHAPAEQQLDLLQAVGDGMDAGEGAIWSRRAGVQQALGDLGWDGAFRSADGDFFADAEFAFAAKNGRGLRRIFRHTATLAPDGSGLSTTVMEVRNTAPFRAGVNEDSHAYLTPYGPRGGVLDGSSDPSDADEPALDGHPTAGWLRAAPPLGATRLSVAWRAPRLALPLGDRRWEYRLTFRPTPGHRGDSLLLSVQLPPGARWIDRPPPERIALDEPFLGRWIYTFGD